jgi:tetratricopeptide (TPR) repeat protein
MEMDGEGALGDAPGDLGNVGGTRSYLSGTARDLVQARDVSGGVNFLRTGRPELPVPRQLPCDVRDFVGRERELEQLDRLLAGGGVQPNAVGISVISGTAGVGKTTLAVHWSHRVRNRFPDGQLYVDLHGYAPGTPECRAAVLDRFLRALGIPNAVVPADTEEKAALYRSLLADRRVLIVLDNAASEAQVRPLLPGTNSCLVVVTSRNSLLRLVGRNGAAPLTVQVPSMREAVELLRAKTAAFRDGDADEEFETLAAACAKLPLALRIVAQRAANRPEIPLGEIVVALRDKSALWSALSSHGADAEEGEEDEAVHSVFAWSYRALTKRVARVFRLLGLHPGPDFTVGAVAALADITNAQAQEALDALAGAHLVEICARGRFRLHSLLHAYALDRARAEDAEEACQEAIRRVLIWYLHAANSAGQCMERYCFRPVQLEPAEFDATIPQLRDRAAAARWFDGEWSNLVAVNDAAVEAGYDRIVIQLSAVFRFFFLARGDLFKIGLRIDDAALEASRRLGDRFAEGEVLEDIALLCFMTGRLDESHTCHEAALEIRRDIGDHVGEAISMINHALVYGSRRRWRQAIALTKESLGLIEEIRERKHAGIGLGNLGSYHLELGEIAEARDLVLRALDLNRKYARDMGIADNLWCLSRIMRAMDQPEEALAVINEAMKITEQPDCPYPAGPIAMELAQVHHALGKHDDALAAYQRAVALNRRVGDCSGEAQALSLVGTLHTETGNPSAAAAFHELAIAMLRKLGDRWQLAVCLDRLGTVLHDAGDQLSAWAQWRECLALLADFEEPAAEAMRTRIRALVAELDLRLGDGRPRPRA